jgi:hypothetical protein
MLPYQVIAIQHFVVVAVEHAPGVLALEFEQFARESIATTYFYKAISHMHAI